MAKLINLSVYDAKNMICVWNETHPDNGWRCGIACDGAMCGFFVPKYYVVGVYDDGSSAAAGISDLTRINQTGGQFDNDLFLNNEFAYEVDLHAAKAFVRSTVDDSGCGEDEARDIVYEKLLESGVTITDGAREYLTPAKL